MQDKYYGVWFEGVNCDFAGSGWVFRDYGLKRFVTKDYEEALSYANASKQKHPNTTFYVKEFFKEN